MRRIRPSCAAWLSLVAIAIAAGAAEKVCAAGVLDTATASERALLAKLDAEHFIEARDQAEQILAQNPNSFVATWAMARVEHEEEANHARALFYVRRAGELVARENDPQWDKKVLFEEFAILSEMDRNAETLAVLDRYAARYPVDHPELRIWPLIKLRRYDEARSIAKSLLDSEDIEQRLSGYNEMMCIDNERSDRQGAYDWALAATRAMREKSCVIQRNGSIAAFARFRLREAEEFALRANKADQTDCDRRGGYDHLAGLYLVAGEFQKSLSAIKSVKVETLTKRLRPLFALDKRILLAQVLYALGKVKESEQLAADLYRMSQRSGLVSDSVAELRFRRTFLYFAALDARLLFEHEQSSYRPLFSGLFASSLGSTLRLLLARAELRRAMLGLLADKELLLMLTRPNLRGATDWAAWNTGGLINVVGTGVMKRALAEARQRDAAFPEATAYLDSLSGEVAFREGQLTEAERLAESALAALPREEALLRFRTQAFRADALSRLGRLAEARPLYQEVLQKFPSVLRILDVALPVSLSTDGSALARAAEKRLRSSSRWKSRADAPFRLQLSAINGGIEICLLDDHGFHFTCTTSERKGSDTDTVLFALDAFHSAAFSPKVSLEQLDLSSLDGQATRTTADEAIKRVLEP